MSDYLLPFSVAFLAATVLPFYCELLSPVPAPARTKAAIYQRARKPRTSTCTNGPCAAVLP